MKIVALAAALALAGCAKKKPPQAPANTNADTNATEAKPGGAKPADRAPPKPTKSDSRGGDEDPCAGGR